MLGSKALLIPGIFVLALGFTLQAGATGAVRAIKLSAKLTGTRPARELPPAVDRLVDSEEISPPDPPMDSATIRPRDQERLS